MTDITVLPGQVELLACQASKILFVAGVGAGKTTGGALWSVTQLINNPDVVGFIGAPSYNQLARVSMPAVLNLLAECGIKYVYGKRPPADWGESRYPEHERILSVKIPGASRPAQALCYTMDDPDAIRGVSVGWAWIDESREVGLDAYNVVQSRLRGQPPGTKYKTLLTTTPNGFTWEYTKFVADPIPDSVVIRASTMSNPFLPAGFVENLRAQFTEQYAKQELEAVFLNLTAGQAFFAFNRNKHVTPVIDDPSAQMWYAVDFNVSPLCSTYGQHNKQHAWVSGEIYIQGSGRTADAAEEFCRRHIAHRNKTVVVYGDQSGANRDTRNDFTDYDVIQRVFKEKGWAVEVRRNFKNPPIVESVEAVNALFEHNRCSIDPTCKRLITDLEQCSWEEGTRTLDKSNAELTHLADSFRYMIYKEFNVGQKATTSDILNK